MGKKSTIASWFWSGVAMFSFGFGAAFGWEFAVMLVGAIVASMGLLSAIGENRKEKQN